MNSTLRTYGSFGFTLEVGSEDSQRVGNSLCARVHERKRERERGGEILTDRVIGTGNPCAGQVIDTAVEVAVGLTTFMSAFVNFGFALDTGSGQRSG